ncbi:MAG: dNTP triphosphohydrolase [Pseudohongiellaceae bacterium]
MTKLAWDKLLSGVRRKDLHGDGEAMGTAASRTEVERDYDRILFATPTRRLADKTQVYPMEENDSVRNRLTHSHEVSNLARSIGIKLAFDHAKEVFGPEHEALQVKRNVPAMLAAVGLAHDLGNPPFGHEGEAAIGHWFRRLQSNNPALSVQDDFLSFDGNAQTLRLLTRLQVLNDSFGLNLTCGTLAALIKYPAVYGGDIHGLGKHGIFQSERDVAKEVWEQTGLSAGQRHPLTYVMEACDDIAYSVIDAEDTVKKGYASFYDLMDYLESHDSGDPVIRDVVNKSRKKNAEFKKGEISSRQLDDISMQMFRVKAIAEMVPAATEVFVDNIDSIMSGATDPGFELIKKSRCSALCKAAKKFDRRYGFQHRDVLKLELKGTHYISEMLTILWKAVSSQENEPDAYDRFVYGDISENYRYVYEKSAKDDYARCQLVCDVVSGMTETYLVNRCNEYKALRHEIS